ncbi:MAG: amidohydrolase family protein [Turicibacter sp.]
MIIDTHTHIGKMLNFDMATEHLLNAMDKYNIDFCLASNITATEVDHNQVPIPNNQQVSQLKSCQNMIEVAKKYPRKIGALLWVKPASEGMSEALDELIKENRAYIYALKFHPYHSKIAFNSEEVKQYFTLARKYHLPIVTHTATDFESSPKLVYEVAKQNPDINFVMVHMGLGSDHEEAIEYISKLPNLYGDSTWVRPEKVIQAIEICGPDKIMFGTDAPINGVDTYDDDMFYNHYLKDIHQNMTEDIYAKFMYQNAMKVFNLKLTN